MPAYNEIIEEARADGNLGLLDNVCRTRIERGQANVESWRLLAEIAASLGNPSRARHYYSKASRLAPDDPEIRRGLAALPTEPTGRATVFPRYLVIREWGRGFWSDVTQVLGGLLIAEATGRRPVIFWGARCRYTDDPTADAFTTFFKPIGNETVADLEPLASRYPAEWESRSLAGPPPDYLKAPAPPPYGPALLYRKEQVAVSDFATGAIELLPWINDTHAASAPDIWHTYFRLFAKYLRPQTEIVERVDAAWREFGSPDPAIAVHIRLTDKEQEGHSVRSLLTQYLQELTRLLREIPDAPICLMTDSRQTLETFRRRYGRRLLVCDSTRTDHAVGLHFQPHPDRCALGKEVLADVLLAARCTHFVGTGWSNVSRSISLIKNWRKGQCRLLGENKLLRRPLSLYDHRWRSALTGATPEPAIRGRSAEKPQAGVLHNLARSGGTIISRCLGTMNDVVLLSEIHPLIATGTFDPIVQARDWHGLFTGPEAADLDIDETVTFGDVFVDIAARTASRKEHLIIRDWSHIDFMGRPQRNRATNRPVLVDTLEEFLTLNRAAIVRHPIDQWLSLIRLTVVKESLTLERYLEGCFRFAKMIDGLPTVRYKDFTKAPDESLEKLCRALGVPFDPTFHDRWNEYRKVTTAVRGARLGEKIEPRPRRKVGARLLDRFARNVHYRRTLTLLGYEHP